MYLNIVKSDWNLDENPLSKWLHLQHCKSIMPQFFKKEWQTMLSSYLVLVTLHGQYIISIEHIYIEREIEIEIKKIGDNEYNI